MFSVPAEATEKHVLAFCKKVSPGVLPVRLVIRSESGCLPRDCFANVQRMVSREGGAIRFGWAIWEWPRVFIEAEHHAVYESPHGVLTDLTPPAPEDQQTARLFLRDDSTVYDFDQPDARRDNIRQALTDDPLIQEYLKLPPEITAIMNRTPGQGAVTVFGADAQRLKFIASELARLKWQIAMKYTAQGASCICGSGQKFKRCHGTPHSKGR